MNIIIIYILITIKQIPLTHRYISKNTKRTKFKFEIVVPSMF